MTAQEKISQAQKFRDDFDFTGAQKLLMEVIAEEPNNAEAYWEMVLCEYGVKYIANNKNDIKPTINKTGTEPVLANKYYLKCLEFADNGQKNRFKNEAKQLNILNSYYLEEEQKNQCYDVFISYKETDNQTGKKTEDSKLCRKIYRELTKYNLKIFYAPQTLKYKLGTRFEPCLHSALKNSKVMLVVATKKEYLTAPWVEYERKYFLNLREKGDQKHIIPFINNISDSDIPKEIKDIQSNKENVDEQNYEWSKIPRLILAIRGAINQAPNSDVIESVNRKLDLAFDELKFKKFKRAKILFKEILDIDPFNGKACLGKLLAELKVQQSEDLRELKQSIALEKLRDFIKAFAYLDIETSQQLENIANDRFDARREYDARIARLKNFTLISLSTLALLFCLVFGLSKVIDYYQNSFVDERDGQRYRTTTIGKRIWMAENLRYAKMKADGSSDYFHVNNSTNDEKFGYLYTYDAATDNACPDGWLLPTKEDFDMLLNDASTEEVQQFMALGTTNDKIIGNAVIQLKFSLSDNKIQTMYFRTQNIDYLAQKTLLLKFDYKNQLIRFINGKIDSKASIRCFKWIKENIVPHTDSFTDERDGNVYKTTQIGEQTWMAQNLRYKQVIPAPISANNDAKNDKKFGLLYSWAAAKEACPAGWYLPNTKDFEILDKTIENISKQKGYSKYALLASETDWVLNCNRGLDFLGLTMLPAGNGNNEVKSFGYNTAFWSSEYNNLQANIYLIFQDTVVGTIPSVDKQNYISVRCIKGKNPYNEVIYYKDFKDLRDNKIYKTVKIGNKIWTMDNMRFAGLPKLPIEHYSANNNFENDDKYGYLYTFENAIRVCPQEQGWRLPTKGDFEDLLKQLNKDYPGYNVGAALMSKLENWEGVDIGGDVLGFNALPSGLRLGTRKYEGFGLLTYFWSSTTDATNQLAYALGVSVREDEKYIHPNLINLAFSVRCIRDDNITDSNSDSMSSIDKNELNIDNTQENQQ